MKNINYSKLVPTDSFIGQFMSMMQEQETPQAYDFFCALWLMSLALGRECVVARPRAPVHLNLYTILVAESGTTRKSSAVRAATKLARSFIAGSTTDLIEAKTTPEALEQLLGARTKEHGHAYVAIAVSELVTFLGKERYNLAMPGLLTDLYDCPDIRRSPGTLSRGSTHLENVFVSFLSASTPSWLVRAINPDVVEGGFTSRVLFIHEERRKKPIPWPADVSSVSGRLSHEGLVSKLRILSRDAARTRKIEINDAALKIFSRWYNTRPQNIDAFRASFESREDSHVLRIAAMLCANDGTWIIQATHIRAAIQIVSDVKEKAARIFVGGGTESKILVGIDKLRELLLAAGKDTVSTTRLSAGVRSFIPPNDVKIVLQIMHELDMVQRFDVSNDGPGRRAVHWRATNAILGKDAIRTVMGMLE